MTTPFPRSSRWRTRALTLAAVYFTFLGGTLVTDLDYWPRMVHHVLVSTILLGWTISLWKRRASIPATPLDVPVTAVAGAWIVATVFALDPRVSVEALWQIGVYALFFYILVDMMRAWGPNAVLEPLFFAAGVVVFVGIFEFVSWYLGLDWLPMFRQGWPAIGGLSQPFPPTIYRLTFTLNVATFLAGYLCLLIPVALAWAIATTRSSVRQGLLLWLGGAVLVMALTFSRGGLLSLGVSMTVFALLMVAGSAGWRERLGALLRDWRAWVAALVVIGLAAGVVVFGFGGDPFGHAAGDKMRVDLLQSAWQIGLSYPITGVGPFGFGSAMRQFRDPTVTGDYFTSSHSIPLQAFAESGLLGVIGLAWLIAVGGWIGWQRWKSASGPERIRIVGVLAALAGFSAQNLADTLVNIPVLLPWLAFGAYLVAPVKPPPGRYGIIARRAIQIALSLAVVVSIAGWALSDVAQYHFDRALRRAEKGDIRTAVDEITIAAQLDPGMGFYAAQRAQYLGQLASADSDYLDEALDAYEVALGMEDTYALMRANHALVLNESGDLDAALTEMNTAVAFQPNDPRYHLGAAAFAEAAGHSAEALKSYRAALDLRPGWVASSYWTVTDLRAQARDEFVRATATTWSPEQLGRVEPRCWEVPLSGAQAGMAVDPMCQGAITLSVLEDPANALPWLDQAVAGSKAEPLGYLLRAEAYQMLGDPERAERDARIALFLGSTDAYVVLGRLAEADGDNALAERYYRSDPPVIVRWQGWDVAVYQRRGDLTLLPLLDAPGPSRYDFAAWLALIDLYGREGRPQDAQVLRDAILRLDPYFEY